MLAKRPRISRRGGSDQSRGSQFLMSATMSAPWLPSTSSLRTSHPAARNGLHMLPVPSNRLRSVLRPGPGRGSGVGVCRGDVIEPGARCGGRRSSLQLTDSVNRANPGGPRCAERERAVVSMSRLLLFVIVRLLSVARLSLRCLAAKCPGVILSKGERRPSSVQASQARLPQGQSPILSGTLARPDIAASRDYRWRACWTGSTPKPLSSALGRLASAWIPGVGERVSQAVLVLLGEPKGFKSIAQCVNSARHLLTSMARTRRNTCSTP
ncbi:hypothetical protein Q5P01_000918 [Channa striata]|uniref:Uncharacterized protein n=1 Tax=Channa striata TaxID=64152 RepID=A0AA88LEK6_CHASR|nr:hypothetical protein Q5P01_000918 [Channa striata]